MTFKRERSRSSTTWPSAAPKQQISSPIHALFQHTTVVVYTLLYPSSLSHGTCRSYPGSLVRPYVWVIFTYVLIAVQIFSPWVILNDFGGAFAMGAVGGGIWHGIKGARNSPRVCYSLYLNINNSNTCHDIYRVSASLAPFRL